MSMMNNKNNMLLGWFVLMALNNSSNTETKITKITKELDKYYKKNSNKFKQMDMQKYVDKLMSMVEKKEWSADILVVFMLDYMLYIDKDTGIRSKFGHILTRDIIDELETEYRDISFRSHKIIKELTKDM